MNIETLTRYKSWADRVFYKSLRQLPEPELARQRPMLFGNILALLNHIYAMDVVWQCNLQGIAHQLSTRNPADVPLFSELETKQKDVNAWYETYAAEQTSHQMSELISFTFIGGGEGQMTRGDIIHHVINHASYHRGHIEGVMYQLEVEPPTTDVPVFLRGE